MRTGDKGLDHNGVPKSNYEPGADIMAKIVVLGEGPRGTLAKQAAARLGLADGREPQVYAAGVKELWQLPDDRFAAGAVIHTLGYPLPPETFGGGFIYGMADNVLDIGLVTGLDYRNPTTDPHNELQRYKEHPAIARMLAGRQADPLRREGDSGRRPLRDAARVRRRPADHRRLGGLPERHAAQGHSPRHEVGHARRRDDLGGAAAEKYDAATLSSFERRFKESWAYTELRTAAQLPPGLPQRLAARTDQRRALDASRAARASASSTGSRASRATRSWRRSGPNPTPTPRAKIDNVLTFDKLTDVYNSGTMHEENQPCHLLVADTDICRDRCTVEYGNPCRTSVRPRSTSRCSQPVDGKFEGRLQINFTNCVHCKTCDIMDPYQIITWVPPQGGEGPVYTGM